MRVSFKYRVCAALLAAAMLAGCSAQKQEEAVDTTATPTTELLQTLPEETVPETTEETVKLAFPLDLAEGKLQAESVFQFTGFNPDADNEEGADIAALQLRNISGEHLSQADLVLELKDGTRIAFRVKDLPAGASMMVFSSENCSMAPDAGAAALSCDAAFLPESPVMQQLLEVRCDNMEITVKNISDQDLTGLNVHCHSLLEEDCYGGLTYCYSIESLGAGQETTVQALDCYLGGALVVRIDHN